MVGARKVGMLEEMPVRWPERGSKGCLRAVYVVF